MIEADQRKKNQKTKAMKNATEMPSEVTRVNH